MSTQFVDDNGKQYPITDEEIDAGYPLWQRQLDGIETDQSASDFIKGAARDLQSRDPVDALLDLEMLAGIFRRKVDELCLDATCETADDAQIFEVRSK